MKKGFFALVVVALMLCATVVPVLADNPGTGNSDFVIQNIDASEALVSVDYYDQTGANDAAETPITIAGHGSMVFKANTLPVGDGWIGSAVVASDKQIAAVTNITWDTGFGNADDSRTGESYSGTYTPGQDLYFPYATVKPVGSMAGKLMRFSQITIQNAGGADAHVQIYYYKSTDGSQTGPIADTIAMGRSKTYNLSTPGGKVPNLGGDWQGAVYVHSDDQPIAGVVDTHWSQFSYQQWASIYEGAAAGGTTLYAPSVFRVDRTSDPAVGTWVRSTNLMVQNTGSSDANVKIQFFESGSATPKWEINDTIGPKRMGEYHTRFGSPTNPGSYPAGAFGTNLGNAFFGSAVITCSNGQPLAAVVHTFWHQAVDNAASSFTAIPAGATDLYIPYAPRVVTGGVWNESSKIAIQNLSADAASITMTYYKLDGTQALALTDTIPGNSGDAYSTRFGSDTHSKPASDFNALGANYTGGVHIHSTKPIVAVVNLAERPLWSATYNAYVP
jgi:hypothetical protein